MPRKRVAGVSLVCLAAISLCSCSTLRFWERGGDKAGANAQPVAEAPASNDMSDAEREAALIKTVEKEINAANRQTRQQQEAVEHLKPYFFKAYSVYKTEAGDADIVIQEKDSHSLPYVADVTLEKQRFSTRMHRKRADAAEDSDFLRETGVETITYEFKNGRWQRAGSMFIAEKTERNAGAEWVEVKEAPVKTATPEEPERGWFSRVWSAISGR